MECFWSLTFQQLFLLSRLLRWATVANGVKSRDYFEAKTSRICLATSGTGMLASIS